MGPHDLDAIRAIQNAQLIIVTLSAIADDTRLMRRIHRRLDLAQPRHQGLRYTPDEMQARYRRALSI